MSIWVYIRIDRILNEWKENPNRPKSEFSSNNQYKDHPEFQQPYTEDEISLYKALLYRKSPKSLLSIFPNESEKTLEAHVHELEEKEKEEERLEKEEDKKLQEENNIKKAEFSYNYTKTLKTIPGEIIYTEEKEGIWGDCNIISIQNDNNQFIVSQYSLDKKGFIDKEQSSKYSEDEFLILIYNENWNEKYDFEIETHFPEIKTIEDICDDRILNDTDMIFISGPHYIKGNPGPQYPMYYFIEQQKESTKLFLRSVSDAVIGVDEGKYKSIDDLTEPLELHIGTFIKNDSGDMEYQADDFILDHGHLIIEDIKDSDYNYLSNALHKYVVDNFEQTIPITKFLEDD